MRIAQVGLVLSTVFALLVLAPAASATTSGCAEHVLRDWHNGHIGSSYAPACYRTALANLPEDMLVYSSAQADIQRALQARLTAVAQGQKARAAVATHKKATRELAGRKVSRSRAPTRAAVAPTASGTAVHTSHDTALPLPVILAAGLVLILVSLASASRAAHRLRR